MDEENEDIARFAERLESATRDQGILLKNLFASLMVIESEEKRVRLHVLKSDGNGRPQVGQLVRGLANLVLDYCIPRKQVISALQHAQSTGSTQRIVALRSEAAKLFTDLTKSGEGGELLLFVLTESVLGYPQVLSKMALKTSSRMHVHGLDGVYVSCGDTAPRLRLHFGESKLHKSPPGSVAEATRSIAPMLKDEGYISSARRDYFLLNTQADLGDAALEAALLSFLDPASPHFLSPEVCAVLLAGHELVDYPAVRADEDLPPDLIQQSRELASVLDSVAEQEGIDAFHIDLFLIPFPDLNAFRTSLLTELGLR